MRKRCQHPLNARSPPHQTPAAPPAWSLDTAAFQIGTLEGDAPYQLHRVRGAALLPNGNIAVLDGGSSELRIFDATGRFVTQAGGRGDGPGEFRRPWAMHLRADTIIVIDASAGRLSLHRTDGSFITNRPYDKDTHTADAWLHDNSVIVGAAHGPQQDRVRAAVSRLPRPDTTVFFREVRAAGDDRLWVRVPADSGQSDWLIFDYTAQPLGRISIPDNFTMYDLHADHVLGVWADALDVQSVRALTFARPPLPLTSGDAAAAAAAPPSATPTRRPRPDAVYQPLRDALRDVAKYQEHFYALPAHEYVFARNMAELRAFTPSPAARLPALELPAGIVVRILDGGTFGWFAMAADTATGALCATGQGFTMPQSWGSSTLACF